MPKKQPFSGKQKKEQLKEKRIEKSKKSSKHEEETISASENNDLREIKPIARDLADLHLKQNKSGARRSRKGKPKEDQYKIDKPEMERWRLDAIQRPLELAGSLQFPFQHQSEGLGIPTRPAWENLSADKLHELEEEAVENWATSVEDMASELDITVSDFEQRVGPWRAVWQLLETCSLFVIVLDARLPPFFYPKSLVAEVQKQGKSVILALNKAELNECSSEWVEYYSSSLLEMNQGIVPACAVSSRDAESVKEFAKWVEEAVSLKLASSEDNLVRIGMLGHPNVGKSSLINALMKHWNMNRAAAANMTPGRTQHNQTFEVLEKKLVLMDCPGISFPLLGLPLPIAVMMGSYSVSQVREPLSVLRFILEHSGGAEVMLGAMKLLTGLKGGKRVLLDLYGEDDESAIGPWSPYIVAECIALRKNLVVRGGKPDVHATCLFVIKQAFLGALPCVAIRPRPPPSPASISPQAGAVPIPTINQAAEGDMEHTSSCQEPHSSHEFSYPLALSSQE